MNAKDYGTPQNRNRVFIVSILRDNIEPYPVYEFPKPFPLELRLKDMLEENVDEKYYLSDKTVASFAENPTITSNVKIKGRVNNSQDGVVCDTNGIAPTHTAGHGNCPKIIDNE